VRKRGKSSAGCEALTLIEVLVVIGLIGLLAAVLSVAVAQARRFSLRVACQENLRQIGQTVHQMALNNGGRYPVLEDNQRIPWWANVYRQWEGAAPLDAKADVPNLQFPRDPHYQLPSGMKVFKCPVAAPLNVDGYVEGDLDENNDARRAANLRRSISYGLNFDVAYYDASKGPLPATVPPHSTCPVHCPTHMAVFCPAVGSCSNQIPRPVGLPYTSARVFGVAPYTVFPPWPPCIHDKYDDHVYADERITARIRHPSAFVLVSESNAGDKDVTGDGVADWTGGRIACDVIARNSADTPPGRCPIVPRHNGMANVLYADIHVELQSVSLTMTGGDFNMELKHWTLTGE